MFRQRQTIFDGKRGDCFRVCIANALELPLEDVPNVCDSEDWWPRTQEFLKGLNLFFCEIECEQGQTMPKVPPLADNSICFGAGIGPRGLRHAVLCRYRHDEKKREHWLELQHDPHPADLGIEKVDIVGWLMVIDPSKPTGKYATELQNRRDDDTDR